MAIVKLVPSNYSVSNSNYVTVTNPNNMYSDTSSTSYATLTSSRASTTSYYVYIKGFNFSSVPSNARVTSITIKVRGYESGLSTSSSYAPRLYDNTSTITGASAASSNFSTSASTITVPYTGDWDTLKGYGSDLGVRVTVRRSNSNTQGYLYIYGAEIEVEYSTPVSVTITNNTSATVTVSDSAPYIGDTVVVSADTLSGITVKDNGTDVTNQFVNNISDSILQVSGSGVTTGFSSSSAAFYQSSSTSSDSWLRYAIGHSAESPYSTSNTSNTYVKPEGSTGWMNYPFDFSMIPSDVTINSVSVKVYGARENATVDSTHVARFQCYSGSIAKGTIQNFTSTSNGLVTVSDVGTWTRNELQNAQLRFEVGYYGGRMLGITWTVSYSVNGHFYTITNIQGDHIILVTSGGAQPEMWIKKNDSWVSVTTAYRKVNGTWTQFAFDQVFESGVNYVTN